jgi:hypothetical protein
MKKATISLFIVLGLLFAIGCSEGGESLESQPLLNELPRDLSSINTCDFTFYNSPDTTLSPNSEIYNIRTSQVYSLINIAAIYKTVNGSWPTSWDDLLPDYMPILPADPITGKAYKLLNFDECDGSATADSIVADWKQDGPTWYTAIPVKESWECYKIDKSLFQRHYEVMENSQPELEKMGTGYYCPNYRVVSIVKSWFVTCISAYLGRHRILPATTEELLEGFVINPDFDLGYEVNYDDNAGWFEMATFPESEMYYFRYGLLNPKGAGGTFRQVPGNKAINGRPIDLSSEDFNIEDFTVLLNEKAFMK